jgi:uncharacterized glyoxalase superfamily protein PhnB
MSTSAPDPKQQARRLRTALAEHGTEVTHGQALDLVARQWGHRDWNTMAAAPAPAGAAVPRAAIPLLRIFDTRKAMEFYVGFLGFEVVWEHRYGEHAPLYTEVVRDGVRLHLTEHHGDASPGAAVYIEVDDAHALQRHLVEQDYDYARPGVEREEWGWVVTVADPFLNRLMFVEPHDGRAGRSDDHGAPVVEEVLVQAGPDVAFDAFTTDLGRWWDLRYAPPGTTGAVIEPGAGGEVAFLVGEHRYVVGRVTTWAPAERLSLAFWLAVDPAHPTDLDITFEADGTGSRVTLTHGGWTAANVAERAKFTDWPVLLGRYAEHVRRR